MKVSTTRLTLAAIAAALLLFPLTLEKPGRPLSLDGTEPTVLLQIASLADTADLHLDVADLEALYANFPYAGEVQIALAVAPQGGLQGEPTYAQALPYALLAAPFWAALGAAGPLLLNLLLWLLAWYCCARLLSQDGKLGGGALLFAGGALALGLPWPYVFRYRAEILVLAAVALALFLAWPAAGRRRTRPGGLVLSGAVLGLAIIHQPLAAVVGALLWVELLLLGGPRLAARWLLGLGATLALVALLSLAWNGRAWPVSSDAALRVRVSSPTVPTALDLASARSLEKVPAAPPRHQLVTFLAGRYRGLLPYFPFVIPALLLGLAGLGSAPGRRGRLLLALLAYGLLLAGQIEERELAAELGEPRWLAALPLFFAFAGPLGQSRRMQVATLAGFALAAPLLLTLTLQPFGSAAPGGPLAAHTRAFPWRWLPLEIWRLAELPGWQAQQLPEGRLWFAKKDVLLVRDRLLSIAGPRPHELWLESPRRLTDIAINLRSWARQGSTTTLASSVDQQQLAGGNSDTQRLRLALGTGRELRTAAGSALYLYRLELSAGSGERPGWRDAAAAPPLAATFAVGAELTWLGAADELERDLFHLQWLSCSAPAEVSAGSQLQALARLRNISDYSWPARGAARVRMSYHWLRADGEVLAGEGQRTDLSQAVAAGAELTTWLSVTAPEEAGSYLLEVDPLYENVAWFSARNGGITCRAPLTVRRAPPPAESPGS